LLREFFQQVTVPHAVWREVVEKGQGRAGANEVVEAQETGWIALDEPTDLALLRLLKRDLDEGEAEARAVAELYDLPKTGTIGLLIRAKRNGLIDLLRPELDRRIHQGGFWIAQPLYRGALEPVGE